MIAPNKELVNTLFSFITSTYSNLLKQYNINMDMEINTSRNRSANTSVNNSRAMSMLQTKLCWKALSKDYLHIYRMYKQQKLRYHVVATTYHKG